ncbi:MAG: hypothetical protein NZM05_09600 [Chloroherpetonaceae bacterium]|nr:hypothetical protein [Chloroherpetonaceae bacterium]
MNAVHLYAARHTDAAHIKEFFTKKLLRETEAPIAIFDGIFYEAKNERVGGLSFHDYLIFSNKSIYFWARGVSKDYLDRFNLGAVSIAAREKDRDFSTLNLTIERENKPAIYLIFDFVPASEVSKLMLLHLTLETEIENTLGKHYLGEIPDELAKRLLEQAKTVVELRAFPIEEPKPEPELEPELELPPFAAMMPNVSGGYTQIYGEGLLDRMKRMRAAEQQGWGSQAGTQANGSYRYSAEFLRNQPRYPFSPPFPAEKLDPITLRRAEAIVRDVISAIPEEYREQAKKDLKEMPERFSNAILAVNELLQNIAKSKETQDFVIQVVETAVKNDGILGAVIKGMKTLVETVVNVPAAQPSSTTASAGQTAAQSKTSTAKETQTDDEPKEAEELKGKIGSLFSSASSAGSPTSSDESQQQRATTTPAERKERKKIHIKS